MAAPGNVLGGNAPDKDHISCGNDSCGCDTKRGDPTKRPTTIYDVVKSGYVAYFCIFITTFEMAPTPSLPVLKESSSSSSVYCAGQRSTPHYRTLEVRPGRITKKLELKYDYDCERDDTNSLLGALKFGWDVVIANNE